MSVTEFFRFPRVCRRMTAGPLGPYVDAFSEQLARLGYAKRSIRTKIRVVAQFSHWLGRQGLGAADVDLTMKLAEHVRPLALWERVGVRERSGAR